jgi:hypothetical protein
MLPENPSHGLGMTVGDERVGYKWRHRLNLLGNLEIFFQKWKHGPKLLGI